MPDGIIFLLLLPAAVIAALALLLDRLTGSIPDRRLRLALPPVLALVTGTSWSFIASGAGTPVTVIAMFLVIGIVAAAGVVTPLPILDGIAPRRLRVLAVLCSSAVMSPLVIALLVNPEQWPRGPAPLIADRLPLVGRIFDVVMSALPTGTPAFDLAFSLLLWVGFYLECVLVAAVVYCVLRTVASLRHEGSRE
jgi:hypothetical protein